MKAKVLLGALSAALVVFGSCKVPDKPAPPTAPPVITAFTVSKDLVSAGEQVQFSFATQRAKSVSIIDQTGAQVPTTFDAAAGTGSASASPTMTSFFVLRAEGEGGRDSAFVQVAVNEDLKSVFLVVVPTVVNAGESVDVLWSAPGGKDVSVKAGTRQVGMGEKGSKNDTPALTTTYVLSATRGDGSKLSAEVAVKVQPVITSFEISPAAARPGKKLKLDWKTAGAERVVLSEATFGELLTSNTAAIVASGSYEFEVPAYFGDAGVPDGGLSDGGATDAGITTTVPPVRDGFPLKFTLTAATVMPAQSVARAVEARVGDGPTIDTLTVPSSATLNKPYTLSWETSNATRIELQANGLTIFAPRAGSSVDGSFTLPGFVAETSFTLIAWDFAGLSVSQSRLVKPVKAPVITSFMLPATVASGTSPIAATWQTTDAANVTVRVKNGASVFFTDAPAQVATGSTMLASGLTTTFVLEARNSAGAMVAQERAVTVSTPLTLSMTPNPASAGSTVTASWDVSSTAATDLPGLASTTAQLASNMAMTFVDLDTIPEANTLYFANRNDGTAIVIAPRGFVFPFLTSPTSTFTVSTNGAIVPGIGAVPAANADVAAPTYAGASLIAPFWDDLDLGAEGSVKWFLDGDSFPRALIIQWTKVQIAGQSGTDLTFQVQLEETGKFLFSYKNLSGPNSDGAGATIGVVERASSFQASRSFNATAVASGNELLWFGGDASRAIGTQPLKLNTSSTFGFFAETGAAKLVPVFGSVRVFAPNAVVVNEVLPVSVNTLTEARWLELYNPTSATVDLSDLEVFNSAATATSYLLPQGTSIDAGAYLVVGDSTDSAANGGAPVTLSWGTQVPLAAADQVSLRVPGTTPFAISSLAWVAGPADAGINASVPGTSVQGAEPAITATAAPLTCPKTRTFGTAMQVGTPGAANETCFEYRLESIPVDFEDISSGTSVFDFSVDSTDDSFRSFSLPAPFTYFGAASTSVTVATNGWLAIGTQTTSALSNRTTPSATSQPVGAIALMWDDLSAVRGATLWQRFGDHTTVMWAHYTHLGDGDDMNFEVKLFDSGVIEFHYGVMTNGSASRYAEGGSATAWIERPTGTAAALAIIRNTAATTASGFISPNTAYRFTPRN